LSVQHQGGVAGAARGDNRQPGKTKQLCWDRRQQISRWAIKDRKIPPFIKETDPEKNNRPAVNQKKEKINEGKNPQKKVRTTGRRVVWNNSGQQKKIDGRRPLQGGPVRRNQTIIHRKRKPGKGGGGESKLIRGWPKVHIAKGKSWIISRRKSDNWRVKKTGFLADRGGVSAQREPTKKRAKGGGRGRNAHHSLFKVSGPT